MTIQTEKTPPTSNIPLAEYRAEHDNNPFAVEYFALDTPFTYLPPGVQEKLSDIDKYVETEIGERGLHHNVASYELVLGELAMELGMDEANPLDQIERVAGYARNMLKLDGLDDIRKTLKHSLRRMRTQKDMDNAVLKAIGRKIV